MQPLAAALRAGRRARYRALVPYVMVDRGRRSQLGPTLRALADAGATAVELGFPFSDPIADGPTLEAAADRALAHGTRWGDLLEQVRLASSVLPTAVMTYANPVWVRGLDESCRALRAAGATGLIVPDLSLEEAGPWRRAARGSGLALVLLAAPSATPARVAEIARRSAGFLYLVSRFGTTGTRTAVSPTADLRPLVAAAHRRVPELPILLGFGVRDADTARAAVASGVDGVVVGSALQEQIDDGASPAALGRWLGRIAAAAGAGPVAG